MERKYHYEYAAYTDNLAYGRVLIAKARNLHWVRLRAHNANMGCYKIERVRVYD